MINRVSIRNFKCLRDVQVDLERFTVFVGPNASGKSSILHALDTLCHVFRPGQTHNDSGLQQSLSRGATEAIELAAEFGDKAYRYRTGSASVSPGFQYPSTTWAGDGRGIATNLAELEWKQWVSEPPGSNPLPRSALLRLEASKLVSPSPSFDLTTMSPVGTGLHTALAGMALNDPDSWQALQANLRRIIPTIRRLRHTKAANVQQPTSLLFDTVGADSVPAHQVSEGTLLVLGLLAALHAPGRPNLVLLDDLDRGLHPKAQKELITLLRSLLEMNPDLQITASTHSPYMLDCMGVQEVRMTFLKDDGATVCAPLTRHPNFPKWKDEMTPGELWSVFGEKWLVGEVAS